MGDVGGREEGREDWGRDVNWWLVWVGGLDPGVLKIDLVGFL